MSNLFALFKIPADGWSRLPPVGGLAELAGFEHTAFDCELPTGLRLVVLRGISGSTATIVDGREATDLPPQLAELAHRLASACVAAERAGSV